MIKLKDIDRAVAVASEMEEDEEEFGELPPEEKTGSGVTLSDLAARHPFAYVAAMGVKEGIPVEVVRALTKFKTTDEIMDKLPKFIAGLKKGMGTELKDTVFTEMLSYSKAKLRDAGEALNRKIVRVNIFNAKAVLDEKVSWELAAFDKSSVMQGKLKIRTKGVDTEIDMSSAESIFASVLSMLMEAELGDANCEYRPMWKVQSLVDMVYFLVASYDLDSNDYGVWLTDPTSYRGSGDAPSKWKELCDGFVEYLKGRTPPGYSESATTQSLLYNEVYEWAFAKKWLVVNEQGAKAVSDLEESYQIYDAWAVKISYATGYTAEKIMAEARKIQKQRFLGNFFQKMVAAETTLNVRRENKEAKYDSLFGLHTMGFSYLSLPSDSTASFTILYQVMYAYCWKYGFLENPAEMLKKAKIRIVICGDQIKGRAPILEKICKGMGWKLVISRKAGAPVLDHAEFIPTQDEWVTQGDTEYETFVYWMGVKDVKVVEGFQELRDTGEDDKRIMQLLSTYMSKYSGGEKKVSLLVHHDLMQPEKMGIELQYLMSRAKDEIEVNMIPHPSNDSKSFCWFLSLKTEHLEKLFSFYYAMRVVECRVSMDSIGKAVMIGRPKHSKGILTNQEIAVLCMHLVQWERSKNKQGGKAIMSNTGREAWEQIVSHELSGKKKVDKRKSEWPEKGAAKRVESRDTAIQEICSSKEICSVIFENVESFLANVHMISEDNMEMLVYYARNDKNVVQHKEKIVERLKLDLDSSMQK